MKKLEVIFVTILLLIWKSEAVDVNVQCNFKNLTFYSSWKIPSAYQCDVKNREDFIGDQVKIVKVSGTHENGHSDNDVTVFKLKYAENLTRIPSNIDKMFPKLVVLRIERSNISEISESDVKLLDHLKFLWISHSNIKIIRNDLFKSHPHLESINLVANHIEHIDHDAFTNLNDLKSLEIHGNQCNSLIYPHNRTDFLKLVEQIKNGECELEKYLITTEKPMDVQLQDNSMLVGESGQLGEASLNKLIIENQQLTQQITLLNENAIKCSNNYQDLTEKFLQSNDKCESRVDILVQQISKLASIIKTLEEHFKVKIPTKETEEDPDAIIEWVKLDDVLEKNKKEIKVSN